MCGPLFVSFPYAKDSSLLTTLSPQLQGAKLLPVLPLNISVHLNQSVTSP